MTIEKAREIEADERKKDTQRTQFFVDHIGKPVTFYIGKSPHHVEIISVNFESNKVLCSEDGLPDSWMELQHIDSYQERASSKSA